MLKINELVFSPLPFTFYIQYTSYNVQKVLRVILAESPTYCFDCVLSMHINRCHGSIVFNNNIKPVVYSFKVIPLSFKQNTPFPLLICSVLFLDNPTTAKVC